MLILTGMPFGSVLSRSLDLDVVVESNDPQAHAIHMGELDAGDGLFGCRQRSAATAG
jgi:hypothetical protein